MFTTQDILTANQDLKKVSNLQIVNGILILDSTADDFEFITITENKNIKGVEFRSKLKKLKYLNLSECNISRINFPATCCPSIKAIHLESNKLKSIVFEENLSKLEILGLSKNNLEKIDLSFAFEYIKYIDVSENKNLKDFSVLGKFIFRKNFDFSLVRSDYLQTPPIEIVRQGNDAIRNYFEQQNKYGKETLFDAKIIIIGEPRAGKTTLRHLLSGRTINIPATEKEQPSTHGINVEKDIEFLHLHNKNVKISTNIWDFGGQDIQYNLHHYFLSSDALYLLVTDLRAEKTRFTYWFQAINFFGTDNIPIIILKNDHGDAGSNDVDIEQYKRDFPNIAKNIFEIRLNLGKIKNEDKGDWDTLRNYFIPQQLEKLNTVGSEGVGIWSDVKDIFIKEKEPFLELSDLLDIANLKGMNSEEDVKYMLRYFHSIGIIIYYEEDRFLNDYVFIKPEWITENLYTALTESNISENGIFEEKKLFNYWQQKKIKHKQRKVLLELMGKDKFDVAYPLNENRYAVPVMFDDLALSYNALLGDILFLKFKFKRFLPKGLISRFIVRMYEYIEHNEQGIDLAWKTGVVLRKNDTRAIVVELTDEKTIDIKIGGADKAAFRSIIIETFEKLFGRYPSKPDLLIPCSCNECSEDEYNKEFYSYKVLLNFVNKGKPIQCRNSGDDIDPSELLNGIKMFENGWGKSKSQPPIIINNNIKNNSTNINGDENNALTDVKAGNNVSLSKKNLKN